MATGFSNAIAAAQGEVQIKEMLRAATVAVQVAGTLNGTLVFEGNIDGSTFFAIFAVDLATGARVNSMIYTGASVGRFLIPVSGLNAVRVRCSAFTSGSATVTLRGSEAGVQIVGPELGTGLSIFRNIDAKATVGSLIKGSQGQVYEIHAYNKGAAAVFVKLYNKATAPSSADTPVLTLPLALTSGSVVIDDENGINFPLGIGVRASTGIADNDNVDPAANDVTVNIFYA